MATAVRAAERPPAFGPEEADDLRSLRAGLVAAPSAGDQDEVRSAIEHVRKAAALVARYDLAHDRPDLRRPDWKRGPNWVPPLPRWLTARPGRGTTRTTGSAVDALLDQATRLAGQAPGLPRLQLAMLAQGGR